MSGENQGRTRGQRVLVAAEVDAEILRISDAMEENLAELVALADEDAQAEYEWRLQKSLKGLEASTLPGSGRNNGTTVDEREAIVTRDCREQLLNHLVARARYSATKETLRVQQSRLNGLQTIAANIRAAT